MKDIIVGVDASTSAEHALDLALLEAERTGCPLRAVHVWTTPVWLGGAAMGGLVVPAPVPEDCRKVARGLVDELVAKAMSRRSSDAAVEVTAEIEEGDPGRVLSRLSDGASLLVMGGSGHGQLASALLGSATTYVLHHATCPVMVVPQSADARPFARVLVGIDGSPSSRAALAWARKAAESLACPLVAVHAWIINPAPVPMPYFERADGSTYSQVAQDWLVAELAKELPDTATVVPLTPYGSAAGALVEEAGTNDLIVVGSRGHGGFASLLLGSVASQTATHARGAVVVIR